MNRDQIRDRVTKILLRLAPDHDFGALRPGASLRKELTADSMDILNFVTALHEELGVDVPEEHYEKIDTLDGCVEYMAAALAARAPGGGARGQR
jgi:acyl carrier protein